MKKYELDLYYHVEGDGLDIYIKRPTRVDYYPGCNATYYDPPEDPEVVPFGVENEIEAEYSRDGFNVEVTLADDDDDIFEKISDYEDGIRSAHEDWMYERWRDGDL